MVIHRGRYRFVPVENSHSRPETDIKVSELEYRRADELGEIHAFVHSHPNAGAYLSPMDTLMHKASNIAWWVIGLPDGADGEALTLSVPAAGEQPLTGRLFMHGVNDCYTLIRDYYRLERGILLLDIEREDEWWLKGQNLYEDNFRDAGFMPVETPEDGDVILMQIRSPVPNHAGIYINGELLHHMPRRLSSRDCYGDSYRERTRRILRYVGPAID